MELDVSPLAGRKYSSLEKHCAVDRSLFRARGSGAADDLPLTSSFRGCCWNPLTKCFLICDPVHCCVRVYRMSIAASDVNADQQQQQHHSSYSSSAGERLQFTVNTDMERIGEKGTGSGKFMQPVAVDVNSRGEIAVADAKLSRVQVFMGSGTLQYYFGRPGGSRGEFRGISDLKFTVLGHLAIVDTGNHRIQIMTQTGGIVMIIGKFGWRVGEFASPCAIDIARNGDLFVCDEGNKRIQRLSAKGKAIAVWGSRRRQQRSAEQPAAVPSPPALPKLGVTLSDHLVDEFGFPTPSPVISVFDSPTDIAISATGEIVVCDSGSAKQQILFFSDTGACRHVLKSPSPWQPVAINFCDSYFITIARSPLERTGVRNAESNAAAIENSSSYEYMLTSYSALQRVAVGKLEAWPVRCVVQTLRFLTYRDAVQIRLVNHFFHGICRALRNEWKLFPLMPGACAVRKYNKVVAPATGLVAVAEAFDKWGLRVFKPSLRIRRHVMDFDAGFCNAISALYGAMFRFQHEEILRALFRYHASLASGAAVATAAASRERDEIDQAAFVEIVTLIEEVRAGFLLWEQCAAFQQQQPGKTKPVAPPPIPRVRAVDIAPDTSVPASLRLVESAQQHQMSKLLLKLRSM